MMPGRTSNTPMPCGARRSANSLVSIDAPAFEMQYSPRLSEGISAFTDVIDTIERGGPSASGASSTSRRATRWVRKNGPRRLTFRQRS